MGSLGCNLRCPCCQNHRITREEEDGFHAAAEEITPAEIAEDDFGFIESLGLKENLSPTRANGLVSMIETIRRAAQENL